MTTNTAHHPASAAQLAYIQRLLHSRQLTDEHAARLRTRLAADDLSLDVAKATIAWMLRQPAIKSTIEPGIYEVDGKIYRVRLSKNNQLYVQVLSHDVGSAERLTASGDVLNAKYVFAPGAISGILPEHRLTVERAAQLSIVYAHCIVCGRHLSAAQSVARGIGPVCAGKL